MRLVVALSLSCSRDLSSMTFSPWKWFLIQICEDFETKVIMLIAFCDSKNDKLVISDRYHSDICDAVLYAFRESLHWLHEPPEKLLVPGTPEWAQAEEQAMEEFALQQAEAEEREAEWS